MHGSQEVNADERPNPNRNPAAARTASKYLLDVENVRGPSASLLYRSQEVNSNNERPNTNGNAIRGSESPEGRDLNPKLLTAEVTILEERLGNMKSPKEISDASEHLDLLNNDKHDAIKEAAWQKYCRSGSVDEDEMWWEIDIYRLLGDTSSSVLAINGMRIPLIACFLNASCVLRYLLSKYLRSFLMQ